MRSPSWSFRNLMAASETQINTRRLLNDRVLLGRVWAFGRPYRRAFVAIAVLGIGGALVLVLSPFVLAALVNAVIDDRAVTTTVVIALLLCVMAGTYAGLRVVQARLVGRV